MINWSDPKSKISRFFTVGEALYLPSWGIYHIPSEQEKKNIEEFAKTIDLVRDLIGIPIVCHVWIRPTSVNCPGSKYHGKNYNQFVGSVATKSAHISGRALDFHFKGYATNNDCSIMREKIKPHLEKLKLRMEGLYGPWIHLDNMQPGASGKRFFKP